MPLYNPDASVPQQTYFSFHGILSFPGCSYNTGATILELKLQLQGNWSYNTGAVMPEPFYQSFLAQTALI